MTKQFTDLVERGPMAQHVRGETVPKKMGPLSRRLNSRLLQRSPDEARYRLGVRQRDVGSSGAKKNPATVTTWSIIAQISGDRLPDFSC
jgi:hypothetical protein